MRIAIYLILSSMLAIGVSEDKPAIEKEKTSKTPYSWKILQHNGRDYLSVEKIFKFYSFDVIEYRDDAVILSHRRMKLELRKNSTEVRTNKVLFHTSDPMVSYDGSLIASTVDLAKMIDPIIRPSYIKDPSRKVEFFLLFDDRESDQSESFQQALGNSFSNNQIPTKFLVSSSSKERTDWLTSKLAGQGSRVIVFHFNSTDLPLNGVQTKALAPEGTTLREKGAVFSSEKLSGNKFDAENIALAAAIHSHIVKANLEMKDPGVARTRHSDMKDLTCPAIMVQFGRIVDDGKTSKVYASAIAAAAGKYMRAITK